MLSKWVTAIAPVVHLRKISLTAAQWGILSIALAQTAHEDVTELHLTASSELSELATWCQGALNAPRTEISCTCENVDKKQYVSGVILRATGDDHPGPFEYHLPRPKCRYAYHINPNVPRLILKYLCTPVTKTFGQDMTVILGSAQAIVSHTSSLWVLGLHNIHLTGEVMSLLEFLLESLPPTLMELHISIHNPAFRQLSVQMKERFFKAVAHVHSLQELHMPGWQHFVGSDARICRALEMHACDAYHCTRRVPGNMLPHWARIRSQAVAIPGNSFSWATSKLTPKLGIYCWTIFRIQACLSCGSQFIAVPLLLSFKLLD